MRLPSHMTMNEIQSCSHMSLGEQIVALASTAKKQRAEVREKELSPADLALVPSSQRRRKSDLGYPLKRWEKSPETKSQKNKSSVPDGS